jgi:hypothetical protein
MNLHPHALAKAAAIFMLCMAILNSILAFIYFPQINIMQLLIPLIVTPLVAGIAGYVFARLYNYFAH